MSKGRTGRGEGQRHRQGSERMWQPKSRAWGLILRSVERLLCYFFSFLFFFLTVLGLNCFESFPLVVATGGYTLVAV